MFRLKRRYKILVVLLVAALIGFWQALPEPLFDVSYSTVVEDSDGVLLSARLAADEQWRFPEPDSVPEVFAQAIVTYEDKRFYSHWGIDWKSVMRALRQNRHAGRIVSGASTIDMQVIRLARNRRKRTWGQKIIEALLALRLNFSYSKEEILTLYAGHAPFGGNVVGLEAAAWRYYGKSPFLLSAGEAATLAVLPNQPSLVRPGKNTNVLLRKRNSLLEKMYQKGLIDSLTFVLSKEEPLPGAPKPLPDIAPHLISRVMAEQKTGARFRTTVRKHLQQRVQEIVNTHMIRLRANEIFNCAVLVIDVPTGNTLAYVGNAPYGKKASHGEQVDIIRANRSTGSTLKPVLTAMAMDEAMITPRSLLQDIPTQYGRYRPLNFSKEYRGAVPVNEALVASLNVPFVRLLRAYGIERFHHNLKSLGLKSLTHDADYYGLTLILGGVETSPWQMGGMYAYWARMLRNFYARDGRYDLADLRPPRYLKAAPLPESHRVKEPPVVSAGAVWLTAEMMRAVKRPDSEGNWQRFGSGRPVAWKTGTSIGFRDAWAVGFDRDFVVVVWVGNADGVGRPDLIGIRAAAPVLFDVFRILPQGSWFDPPYDELTDVPVCAQSGYQPATDCPVDSLLFLNTEKELPMCRYHRRIWVERNTGLQVTRACADGAEMEAQNRFYLPPVEAYYYRKTHPDYEGLPPFKRDCAPADYHPMQLVYPRIADKLLIPNNIEGQREKTVFEVAYDYPGRTLYWHLDGNFIGTTRQFHQMALSPAPGHHRLVITDRDGNRLVKTFEVLENK